MAGNDKNDDFDFEEVPTVRSGKVGQEVTTGAKRGIQVAETGPVQQSQSLTIMDTIQKAVLQGNVNIDTINRLVELHERFAAAEAKRQFDEAFARAKGSIKVVGKDGHVGYEAKNADKNDKGKDRTDYDYATLASIYDAAVPALSANGLSYDFDIKQEVIEGGSMKITVGCTVTHAGGHSKRVEMFGPPEAGGNKPIHKAIASAVTIFSRLTLKAALGIAERKDPSDDDGTAADEAAVQASGPEKINTEQLLELKKLAEEVGANMEGFCNHMKVDRLDDLPSSKFEEAKKALEFKRAQAKKQAARK
jgi:hypothetical protein